MASTDQSPMSDQQQPVEVPEEAVQAVARLLYQNNPRPNRPLWTEAPDWERNHAYPQLARRVLNAAQAAAPFLTASRDKLIEELEGKLGEATTALVELIALRRWLESQAGRMPDERADAYRIAKGSSHWGRAERIVATLETSDPGEEN